LNDPSNTPPPVKLNAVRALAVACRSGAKVHAKTVLNLLTDAKWPLYIKYHALKAAENLLAAGDQLALSEGQFPWKHSIPDADVAALVKAIEGIIGQMNRQFATAPVEPVKAAEPAKPAAPATNPQAKPATPPAKPAEPQKKIEAEFAADPNLEDDVALFVRKQAVKALSKVRLVSIAGPNKTIAARPGVTLARIAVGDPWFTGGATAVELADAVCGLAGMNLDGTTNVDVLLDAIAAGVSGFGGEKVRLGAIPAEGSKPDYKKMVAWKKTAAQMDAALNSLRQSPDKNPIALVNRTAIGNLVSTCSTYVLVPILTEKPEGTAAPVNQIQVDDFRRVNQRKSDLLIQNDPDSKVTLPNQRAAGR
jgi:hypothetical protein